MSDAWREAWDPDTGDRAGPECREVRVEIRSERPGGGTSRSQSSLNSRTDRQRIGSDRVQSSACSTVSVANSGSGIIRSCATWLGTLAAAGFSNRRTQFLRSGLFAAMSRLNSMMLSR